METLLILTILSILTIIITLVAIVAYCAYKRSMLDLEKVLENPENDKHFDRLLSKNLKIDRINHFVNYVLGQLKKEGIIYGKEDNVEEERDFLKNKIFGDNAEEKIDPEGNLIEDIALKEIEVENKDMQEKENPQQGAGFYMLSNSGDEQLQLETPILFNIALSKNTTFSTKAIEEGKEKPTAQVKINRKDNHVEVEIFSQVPVI